MPTQQYRIYKVSTVAMAAATAFILSGGSAAYGATTTPTTTASDLYVNCRTGTDSNAGTVDSPLRTPAKAAALRPAAGSTIWLVRDCTWDGQVKLTSSGTSTAPVTLAAYGTGIAAPVLTGTTLGAYQSVLQLTGTYQRVVGLHISRAPGTGISMIGTRGTVTDVEVDDVGIGVMTSGAFGVVSRTNVHDLHMLINTVGGSDDVGAIGFAVQAPDVEITQSSCTNCRAPSYDFGYDGGFVEVWNYGDRLYVHDNTSLNTQGILEIGGNSATASARGIVLARNKFYETHGGVWIHTSGQFGIPLPSILMTANTIAGSKAGDPVILGGNTTNLTLTNNFISTAAQVSWSSAPVKHEYNTYNVRTAGNVGYALNASERLVLG